jgi:hypothetical protein
MVSRGDNLVLNGHFANISPLFLLSLQVSESDS